MRLDGEGDGVGRLDGALVHVPGALPGETWLVRPLRLANGRRPAEALERLAGGERAVPPCPHFGVCGGCALQHAPAEVSDAYKVGRIVEALAREGVAGGELLPIRRSPLQSRRRLRLAAAHGLGGLVLGYRQRAQHRLVDVAVCPIARPELVALFAGLRERLPAVRALGRQADLQLTLTETGIDLVVQLGATPSLHDRERLAALAAQLDLARLSVGAGLEAEVVVQRRAPVIAFGDVTVALPPGAFLQATQDGEAALQAAVAGWVGEAPRLLDLYAGLGTLSLPLSGRGRTLRLIEQSEPAVAAVLAASRGRPGITAEVRDLGRRPIPAAELDGVDAVVLDPPRAGAPEQAAQLAATRKLSRLVYASCHPTSFARDAATLIAGGWRLAAIQPIDQFLFSPEVELAASFVRDAARPPRAKPRTPA